MTEAEITAELLNAVVGGYDDIVKAAGREMSAGTQSGLPMTRLVATAVLVGVFTAFFFILRAAY
jgi:hypothetical protein